MAATQYNATVQKAYVAFYGRPADPSGLAYWTDKLAAANGNLAEIIQAFGKSAEATALFGSKSNLDAINSLYQQIFGRAADPEGLLYYNGELLAGRMTLIDIAQRVIDGAKGDDEAIVANRLTAAQSFTDSLNTAEEILSYQGDAAAASARTWMSTVSGTAASLTAATAAIDTTVAAIINDYGSSSNPGSTFTLTTSSNTITGTEGNDEINAPVTTNAAGTVIMTYSAVDVIDGKAGTDTLYVQTRPNSQNTPTDAVNLSLVKSVEVVRINAQNAATVTLPADNAVTSLENVASTGALTFNSVGNASTAVTLTATSNDTTLVYKDKALEGSSDKLAVTLNATGNGADLIVQGATATTNSLESIALTSLNDSSIGLNITNAGVTAITVSGAGDTDLTVTGASTFLKSIDASGATGDVTLGNVAGVSQLNVTGGSGDDTLTTSGTNATVSGGAGDDTITAAGGNDVIDGGAGDDVVFLDGTEIDQFDSVSGGDGTDILALSGDITYDAKVTTTQAGERISGFEIIATQGETVEADLTQLAANNKFTKVIVDSGTLTLTEDSGITAIDFINKDNANDAYIESAGKQTVTLGEASTQDSVVATLGTAATELTVNSTALSTATDRNSLTVLGSDGAPNATVTKVALVGANPITLTASTATKITSVDASGLTASPLLAAGQYAVSVNVATATGAVTFTPGAGAVSVTTGAGADTLTGTAGNDNFAGGAGNDVISAGAGNDTINGGSGSDSIVAGDGNDTVNATATDTGNDTISGGAGNDNLNGAAGNDVIDGGEGADTITGNDGADSLVGGAGNDVISDGAGNDTILGGDGADTITLGSGFDSLDAGAGNDTINSANTLGSGDTVSGGDGTDTLVLTGLTGTARPTLTSIEVAQITVGASVNHVTFGVKNITDGSLKSITISASGDVDGDLTLGDLVSGTTVTFSDDRTTDSTAAAATNDTGNFKGALTVDMADDTSGTLTLNIAANVTNTSGPTTTDVTSLSITDAGTVTINSTGGTSTSRVVNELGSLTLDSDATLLTINASSNYTGVDLGDIDAVAVQELSLNATGTASSVTGGNFAAAEALTKLTLTASGSGSSITLGNIGDAALTSLTAKASGSGSIDLGTVDSGLTTLASLVVSTTDRGSSLTIDAIDAGNITSATFTIGANTTFTGPSLTSSKTAGNNDGTIAALTLSTSADSTIDGSIDVAAATVTKATITHDQYSTLTGSGVKFGNTKITELNVTAGGARDFLVDANEIDYAANTTGGTEVGTPVANDGIGLVAFDVTKVTKGTLNFASATGQVTVDVTGGFATSAIIYGGSNLRGDDLTGAAGADSIYGGDGNDVINGAAGKDRLVGDAGKDTITGGTGADSMSGGAGDDTFVIVAGDSVASTKNTLTTAGIAAGDTIVFGNGVDYISDFSPNDVIDNVVTADIAPTTLIGVATATALTNDVAYVLYGTWEANTGTFTVAAEFNVTYARDALLVVDGEGETAITTTGVVILDNLTEALGGGGDTGLIGFGG